MPATRRRLQLDGSEAIAAVTRPRAAAVPDPETNHPVPEAVPAWAGGWCRGCRFQPENGRIDLHSPGICKISRRVGKSCLLWAHPAIPGHAGPLEAHAGKGAARTPDNTGSDVHAPPDTDPALHTARGLPSLPKPGCPSARPCLPRADSIGDHHRFLRRKKAASLRMPESGSFICWPPAVQTGTAPASRLFELPSSCRPENRWRRKIVKEPGNAQPRGRKRVRPKKSGCTHRQKPARAEYRREIRTGEGRGPKSGSNRVRERRSLPA